jgi:hypothetical protein
MSEIVTAEMAGVGLVIALIAAIPVLVILPTDFTGNQVGTHPIGVRDLSADFLRPSVRSQFL